MRLEDAPRSAKARSAARTRPASTSEAAAAAGCSLARLAMPPARSSSMAPRDESQVNKVSKLRTRSPRGGCALRSVLTKSSHSRDRDAAERAGRSRSSARRLRAGVAGFTGGYVTSTRVPEQAICTEFSSLRHGSMHFHLDRCRTCRHRFCRGYAKWRLGQLIL